MAHNDHICQGKADDISPKLKNFLNLVRGITSQDSFVKKLEKKLKYAKQNAAWRRKYMITKLDRLTLIDEAMARGKAEGIAIGEKRGSTKTLDMTTLILKDAGIDPAIIEKLRVSILGSQ